MDLWRYPGETVSCGAAQFDPSRTPCFPHLRTGFQVPACTVSCTRTFNTHTAGRFGLARVLLVTLAFVLASSSCVHGRDLHSVSLSHELLSLL